ncbi:MAG: TIR domain-containing protein [Chloroflexi bacterium]|nr:TIR domain-containing protein [Chloroflexota bacterium]
MKRIFISYSRRNKPFAERLARDLSDAGLDVWIDFRQIEGGERWRDEIFKGLEKSEAVVYCISPDAIKSEWCRREVATARGQNKVVYPIVVVNALEMLEQFPETEWISEIQFITFENRYEQAITELIAALSGRRDAFDDIDADNIPNPFKGLEAFQQTDSHIFFGREDLIKKLLDHLRVDIQPGEVRFLAVVGASGSGKSSLVRAGLLPALRAGLLPGSDLWPITLVTPGASPTQSLAARLTPLLPSGMTLDEAYATLFQYPDGLPQLAARILQNVPDASHMLLVVDQFEEVFTRASDSERQRFIDLLYTAATQENSRVLIVITMRADFFGSLSKHALLAELFERENMVIATEMSPSNLRRGIEGPAEAVGLIYDAGLVDRILDDVSQQPGSLPLLQYALKELYLKRDGRKLTLTAYEDIGGVQRALAGHAEDIYNELNAAQQDIMRRVLLRLVEVSDGGEATRRRVSRYELAFRGVSDDAVQEVLDLLTAADSRLLIASREIPKKEQGEQEIPTTWLEVSHEALIRQWERFKSWIATDAESLRYGGELLKAARDWERGGKDIAYLLTGNRLKRAEAWLENADANPIQRAFVQASVDEREKQEAAQFAAQQRELEARTRTAQRLRRFAIVLGVFAIISTVLLVFLVFSLRAADEANTRAAQQRDEAQSLALAANASRVIRDGENDLALALAVAALNNSQPPIEAQRALAELAYLPGTRRVLQGHEAAITSLALNAAGTQVLTGSEDFTLILWDIASGTLLQRFGTPLSQQGAAPAPALSIQRESATATPTPTAAAVAGHSNRVTAVGLTPDGTHALSAGADNQLLYWDTASGQQIWRESTSVPVRSIAISPDGQFAALGNTLGNIIMRNLSSGETFTLTGGAGAVLTLAYSPDGQTLLSGTFNGSLILWDVNARAPLLRFSGHTGAVNSVAFSRDGLLALSGSNDGSARLWDVVSGQQTQLFTVRESQVTAVALNEDATRALAADKTGLLLVWSTTSGELLQELTGHEDAVNAVTYLSGSAALSVSADATVRVWDTTGSELLRRYAVHEDTINSLAISPDGNWLVSASEDSTLLLINRATDERRVLAQHQDAVTAVTFTPDSTRLVSASSDESLIVWDVASAAPLLTFSGHTDSVQSVAVSPDGTQVASGDASGLILRWDIRTGQELMQYGELNPEDVRRLGHLESVNAVVFSPDSTQLLSGDDVGIIILWEAAQGLELRRFGTAEGDDFHEDSVTSLAFSPDGTQALSGSVDRRMILWEVSTGQAIRPFLEQGNWVMSVTFSRDGRVALSGGLDGTVRLWDVDTGTELRRYGGTDDDPRVYSVAFSPDQRLVASGGTGGSISEWRVFTVPADLIDWTRNNRFVRDLTCDERSQFRAEPLCS